ncbi:MAG: hypothetical protein ACREQQ_17325 [Candidatus Binatia bacterium]
MNPTPYFAIQFAWFLIAWTAVAVLLVAPLTRRLDREDALAVWMAPQLFRVLGIGLLVSNLSPEMPRSFAIPTAIGDSLTAVLALTSLIALRQRWRLSLPIAWACNLVGAADLAIALPHAATIEAARFLSAQWYVPVLGVPLMIVSHVMAFRVLLRHPR